MLLMDLGWRMCLYIPERWSNRSPSTAHIRRSSQGSARLHRQVCHVLPSPCPDRIESDAAPTTLL